jgi:hypothetical protein
MEFLPDMCDISSYYRQTILLFMYGTSDQKSVFTLNTVGRSSVFPKTSTQDHLSAQLARAHMVSDGISLYSPRDKGAAVGPSGKEQYKGRIPGF